MQGMLKLLPESRKRQKRYCSIIPDILSSGPLVRSMSTTAFKAVQGLFENQKSCISSIFKQPQWDDPFCNTLNPLRLPRKQSRSLRQAHFPERSPSLRAACRPASCPARLKAPSRSACSRRWNPPAGRNNLRSHRRRPGTAPR